MFQIPSRDSN